MARQRLSRVIIHDFRVTDRVLARTDPGAGHVVFLGRYGDIAFPFVVWRKIAGAGGWYVDACEIFDPEDTRVLSSRRRNGILVSRVEQPLVAAWEKKYEIEGESIPTNVVDEARRIRFPHPGRYRLRYSVFDEPMFEIPFTVVAEDPPYGIIVPGPLDAALSKSTILWLRVPQPAGPPVEKPAWFGYEDGRIYVLTGEGEQQIPGLTETTFATVIARSKDKQSRVAENECSVVALPKGPEWDKIARDLLVGRRLNLTDAGNAIDRWKKDCEIVALTPVPAPARDSEAVPAE